MLIKNYLYCLLVFVLFSCSKKDAEPAKSSAKSITSFAFNSLNPAVKASIDSVQHTIKATLPFGADASKLVPTITISSKATVSPTSGIVQDFTKPVTYTVTAEDGSSQSYVVNVSVTKSSAKNIKTFNFMAFPTIIVNVDSTKKTISATFPTGTDITKLTPTITFSDKASVSPASGVIQDFTKPITYTVTAEDGTKQVYDVSIKVTPASDGIAYIASDEKLCAINIQTGTKKWEFKMSGDIQLTSSPTVKDGVVYVGDYYGNLYALDANTGVKQWVLELGKSIKSTPIVVNKILYVGNSDGLYAINISNGSIKWTYSVDIGIISSPTVSGSIVYVGSYDNYLYAINANTGTKIWSFKTNRGGIITSPSKVNNVVYFGAANYLYAVDASTGTKKWDFYINGDVVSSPTVVNDIVYVGSGFNGSKLSAVDTKTGTKVWESSTGSRSNGLSSPIVVNNIVYVGGSDKNLYIFDAKTGIQKWQFETSSTIGYSSPVVVDDVVYISNQDGKLYTINALTGSKKWEYKIGTALSTSSPCVVDSKGYVYYSGISGDQQ